MEKISGNQLIDIICNRLDVEGKSLTDHQILKLLRSLDEHSLAFLIKNKK